MLNVTNLVFPWQPILWNWLAVGDAFDKIELQHVIWGGILSWYWPLTMNGCWKWETCS